MCQETKESTGELQPRRDSQHLLALPTNYLHFRAHQLEYLLAICLTLVWAHLRKYLCYFIENRILLGIAVVS